MIPALNAGASLGRTLATAVELRPAGLLHEVIVVDAGSSDSTVAIAASAGATVLAAPRGRGTQLAAGAAAATAPWLLFLHADTTLSAGWVEEVGAFIAAGGPQPSPAAVFHLRLDDGCASARRLEKLVAWRTRVLGLPYGDQGLLIAAETYRSVGGYADIPLMEDVDLVRRLGRQRIVLLRSAAQTSAVRYRKDGYVLRPARNLALLALYFCGVSPARLVRLYG